MPGRIGGNRSRKVTVSLSAARSHGKIILYLEAEDISTIILIVDILDDSMQYGGRNAVVFFQGIIFFSIV